MELEEPFVWPEEPESFDEWNKDQNKMAEEDSEKFYRGQHQDADTYVNEDRAKSLREQAKALLEGKKKWKPMSNRQAPSMLTR